MSSTKKLSLKNFLQLKNTRKSNSRQMFKNLTENPITYLKSLSQEKAVQLLKEASQQYYAGTPVLTDDMFDILQDYVYKLDPSLKEIGAAPTERKVKLPFWMGSLDKIRDDPKALDKWKKKYNGNTVISDKLDGNSALYVGKKLYSRGDGIHGQDISHLLPFIKGIPLHLDDTIAVRGELIISKADWLSKGLGANARNAVAGVMHSKVPVKELAELIQFVAYEKLNPLCVPTKGLEQLKELGFNTVHTSTHASDTLTMDYLSKILLERRKDSPFDIDGIVVCEDALHPYISGENPRYAFAFKSLLTHTEAEVIVSSVEWNASKDGYLKPLLHFDPVVLSGAKIQKATGFNAKFITDHVIGPGSKIVIIRSGDVIPHVVRVVSPSASGEPSFPKIKWVWNSTHVDIMLKDVDDDSSVVIKRLTYFATTLDIKGVGAGVVEKMYTHGITTIKQLLNVSVEDLVKMDGFKQKSATKVVEEIKASLAKATCATYMDASNLFGRSIGTKKLKVILSAIPAITSGYVPTLQELKDIDGIASITAVQFLEGLPEFFKFMKDAGLPCKSDDVKANNSAKKSLVDLSVVFTGIRDKELEAIIEARKGKIATAVTKKTTVVVAKDIKDDSSKIKTARELGIPVVDLETFKKNYL
jgi:DNA ligase (NAD+)